MKAKLVIDKTRNGFRAIVQHETSNNTFYPSHPNVSINVDVIEASDENIRAYLHEILKDFGVQRHTIVSVDKLAEKFRQEIATYQREDLVGCLAYNETQVGKKWMVIMKEI